MSESTVGTRGLPDWISHRRLLILTVTACVEVIAILLSGCRQVATTTQTPTATLTATHDDRLFIVDSVLVVSEAPSIGKTVGLTFTVDVKKLDEEHPQSGLANSRAWIEAYWTKTDGSYSEAYSSVQIPSEEVLVSGQLPWNGNYAGSLALSGQIKLPKDGIWRIVGYFAGEGWSSPARTELKIAAVDGTAAIMGTSEFKTSSLAYLGYFAYGKLGPMTPDEKNPLTLELDISKPPRAGEAVTLSCRINSLIDAPDVSIKWSFFKKGAQSVPADELLTSADLSWKVDVKKNVPVVFSTSFKLPTEGQWDIAAVAKTGANTLSGSAHELKITITSTKSYYGWEGG